MSPTDTSPDFTSIVQHFQFDGGFTTAELITNGHIHSTYALFYKDLEKSQPKYILQEINTTVFRQPELVMENILKITDFLREAIQKAGGDPMRETLTLVPTVQGDYCHQTEAGDYWRAMLYIDGAQTYQRMPSTELYFNASRAFGKFQRLLAGFPASDLHVTIPDFHHTPKRLQNFIVALDKDSCNRAITVKDEIQFILERHHEAGVLIDLLQQGKIPLRVTHNDTKLDNVLIDDQTGEGICVIDLDTVMPGLFLYDFGDTVRAAANTSAEDEPDLSRVNFNREVFELLVRGYLAEMRDLLTPTELENLAFGGKLILYEQAIRFLTDFLNGDIYYRIHRQNHNLDRTRTQIKLIRDMEANFEALQRIVEDCSRV